MKIDSALHHCCGSTTVGVGEHRASSEILSVQSKSNDTYNLYSYNSDMTQTAWAHLPNAKHIDRILASLNANPQQWADAWNKIYPAGTTAARGAAWDAAWDAARGAVWGAVWVAISALIAYDDCAYMLESEVGELRILAALGDQKAILLVPSCLAFTMIEMEPA